MWPLTFYVKSLPPDVGGTANGPVIRILEKYRDDRGIYEHEVVHVMQWLVGTLIGCAGIAALCRLMPEIPLQAIILGAAVHPALYKLLPDYRLWAEAQAYKEQAKHYADDRKLLFAEYISKYYGLNIHPNVALEMLK